MNGGSLWRIRASRTRAWLLVAGRWSGLHQLCLRLRHGAGASPAAIYRTIYALIFFGGGAALAQDAPYGLSWGLIDKVPRPSIAEREANITALIYRGDALPSGTGDSSEIVLEICEKEGLQSIIWVSRPFSESDGSRKWAAIVAEGNRRHGPATINAQDTRARWPMARTSAVLARSRSGVTYVVMASAGPDLDSCSNSHFDATNHFLMKHLEDLLARLEVKAPNQMRPTAP